MCWLVAVSLHVGISLHSAPVAMDFALSCTGFITASGWEHGVILRQGSTSKYLQATSVPFVLERKQKAKSPTLSSLKPAPNNRDIHCLLKAVFTTTSRQWMNFQLHLAHVGFVRKRWDWRNLQHPWMLNIEEIFRLLEGQGKLCLKNFNLMLHGLWHAVLPLNYHQMQPFLPCCLVQFLWLEYAELCFFPLSGVKRSQFWKTVLLAVTCLLQKQVIPGLCLLDLLVFKFQHLSWDVLLSLLTALYCCSWPSRWNKLCCWVDVVLWASGHSNSGCMEICVSTLRLLHSPICCHVLVCRFIKGPANKTSCLHHCHSMMLLHSALEGISLLCLPETWSGVMCSWKMVATNTLGAYLHMLCSSSWCIHCQQFWPLAFISS